MFKKIGGALKQTISPTSDLGPGTLRDTTLAGLGINTRCTDWAKFDSLSFYLRSIQSCCFQLGCLGTEG